MRYNCPSFYRRVFNTPLGQNLWDFLNQPSTIAGMQRVSDEGRPAVKFLEEELPRRLKQAVARNSNADLIKQMIGNMVRQVLEENGYRHHSHGHLVRPEGGLFRSGSRYEPN